MYGSTVLSQLYAVRFRLRHLLLFKAKHFSVEVYLASGKAAFITPLYIFTQYLAVVLRHACMDGDKLFVIWVDAMQVNITLMLWSAACEHILPYLERFKRIGG